MCAKITQNFIIQGRSLNDPELRKNCELQLFTLFTSKAIYLESREFIEDIAIHFYREYIIIQIPTDRAYSLHHILKLLYDMNSDDFSRSSLLDGYSEEEKKINKLRHLPRR